MISRKLLICHFAEITESIQALITFRIFTQKSIESTQEHGERIWSLDKEAYLKQHFHLGEDLISKQITDLICHGSHYYYLEIQVKGRSKSIQTRRMNKNQNLRNTFKLRNENNE